MKNKTLICLIFLFVGTTLFSQQLMKETPEEKAERLEWWTHDRFGMFIHWGLYALPARHEWVRMKEEISNEEYQKYFEVFYPDMFNPKRWAQKAKEAGMKYMVVTAKHHEGFCLWDTKYTDYKVTNTPWGKDLLKPMLDAFRDEGIRVGIYYSLIDWHHPEYTIDFTHPRRNDDDFWKRKRDMDVYREYMRNQVEELLTDYGRIDLLFLDFSVKAKHGFPGKGSEDWGSKELLSLVRKHQPHVIVNDRLDLLDNPAGWDFRSPEQFMPREWVEHEGEKVPWETCQTFSGSWGYFRDEYTWKTIDQLCNMLIETVSKGGNLLLNVGPTGRGYIDDRAIDRLEGMGEWMKYNNRSIYGCTQAPEEFKKPDNCLLTYNEEKNRLYVHVLEWPFKKLHLDGYKGKVTYAQFLHDASEVQFEKSGGAWMDDQSGESTLTLLVPVKKPDVEVPVIELYLKKE
jgi:alpha-L-fucosidase